VFVGPARCEVASTLAADRCGRSVARGDVAAAVAAITAYAADPALATADGARARECFERSFGRDDSAGRLAAIVTRLA